MYLSKPIENVYLIKCYVSGQVGKGRAVCSDSDSKAILWHNSATVMRTNDEPRLELAGGGQSASSFSVDILAIMQQEPAIVSRAANDPSVFTITEKAPTCAFSWLKARRRYTKQTPRHGE